MRTLAATVADDIRNVAGLASLTLALIAFFTNRRAETLKRERTAGIPAFSRKTLVALVPEAALLFVTLVALVAMAPLLEAVDLGQVGRRAGALPTMFALIWLGFAGVGSLQVYLVATRLRIALANRKAERGAKRGA